MFEPANLAAACKLCNGYKSVSPISANGERFTALSSASDDYIIVHPHLDEWHHHLKFDDIGRIVVEGASTKGRETIRICKIFRLNAARLADEFSIEDTKEAETALRTFHEVDDLNRKRAVLDLLTDMAQRAHHPGAFSVIEALQEDVAQQELVQAAASAPAQADLGAANAAPDAATTQEYGVDSLELPPA
jgi:hypothetical protein